MERTTQPDWTDRWLDRYHRRREGWKDGTAEFHDLCRSVLQARRRILELGPGGANPTSSFVSTLTPSLVGLDVDPGIRSNAHLTHRCLYDGLCFPFMAASFDAVISNYVQEHVADPNAICSEIARVLTPGGLYVFRTPNRFHYVALVSGLTPHWFHERVSNRLRRLTSANELCRTFYRWNSARRIRKVASRAGLEIVELNLVEKEPSYGRSSRALFLLFLGYERLVNSVPLLASLRTNIFGVLRHEHPRR